MRGDDGRREAETYKGVLFMSSRTPSNLIDAVAMGLCSKDWNEAVLTTCAAVRDFMSQKIQAELLRAETVEERQMLKRLWKELSGEEI